MGSSVDLTTHNTHHLDLPKRALAIEIWDQRSDPDNAAERSDQQRRRLTDPLYYEASVQGLKVANQNRSWTRRRILAAIREFNSEYGRPPKQVELRRVNYLPSYQAVWRRFRIPNGIRKALVTHKPGGILRVRGDFSL